MSHTIAPGYSAMNSVLLHYVRHVAYGVPCATEVRRFNFGFLRALRESLNAGSRLPYILGVTEDVAPDLMQAGDDALADAVAEEQEPILMIEPPTLSYLNACVARGDTDLCQALLGWAPWGCSLTFDS